MESGRVEQTTRKRRLRSTTKTFRESSTPPRSAPKRRKITRTPTPEREYPAKQILRERRAQGVLWYLIDWEDDQVTCDSWPPSWVQHSEVGRPLIAEWQRRERIPRTKIVQTESQLSSSDLASGPNFDKLTRSEIREGAFDTARWRPGNRTTHKKPRKAGSIKTARFQSVLQDRATSEILVDEIKDSYESEDALKASDTTKFNIEVPAVHETFNRAAYALVSSSQVTQSTLLSQISSLTESPDLSSANFATPSQSHIPKRKATRFIWDEDLVVPDSQEPDTSSYQPLEAQHSYSNPSTGLSREKSSQEDTTFGNQSQKLWLNSSAESASGFEGTAAFFDNLSYQPHSSLLLVESEQSSFPTGTDLLSTEQNHLNVEGTQTSQPQDNGGSLRAVDALGDLVECFSQPENTLTSLQSLFPPLLVGGTESSRLSSRLSTSPYGISITSSPTIHHQLSLAQSSGASELQFQTQLPLVGDRGEELGAAADDSSSSVDSSHPRDLEYPLNTTLERLSSRTCSPKEANPLLRAALSHNIAVSAESVKEIPKTASQSSAQRVFAESQRAGAQWSKRRKTQSESGSAFDDLSIGDRLLQTNSEETSLVQVPALQSQDSEKLNTHAGNRDSVLPSIEFRSAASSPAPIKPSPPSSSRLPKQYENTLLARPSKSLDTMDSQVLSNVPPISTAARIKQARAAAAAAHRAASLTPSLPVSVSPSQLHVVSPSGPASEMPWQPASMTSSRSASATPSNFTSSNQMNPDRKSLTEVVPVHMNPPVPAQHYVQQTHATDNLSNLTRVPLEFSILLPLTATTRAIYTEFIAECKPQIRDFLSVKSFNEQITRDIDDMLSNLEAVCDHSDLTASDYSTQRAASDSIQARWAENTSTKCMFVAEFLEGVRGYDVHIGIVVRPGRMIEIIEALLRWQNYTYARPDAAVDHHGNGAMRVTLLAGGFGDQGVRCSPANAVILFDAKFARDIGVKDFRACTHDRDVPAPLMQLVVTQSVEHLSLYLDRSEKSYSQKKELITWLCDIGDDVGKLEHGFPGPSDAARAAATFIVSGVVGESWPLPPLPRLKANGIIFNKDTHGEPTQLSGSTTQSYHESQESLLPNTYKRHLTTDKQKTSESSKRQRLSPIPNESRATVTDGQKTDADYSPDTRGSNDRAASQLVETMEDLDVAQGGKIAALMEKIVELEREIQAKEANETKLQLHNQTLEARCVDLQTSITRIQPRYQEALNERGLFEHEAKVMLTRSNVLQRSLESRITELANLREVKASVDAELVAARHSLSTSSAPDTVAFHKLQEELRSSRAEIERFQKRQTALQSEMDYMRMTWQQASSAAASSAREVSDLETKIAVLRIKANQNVVQIHKTNNDGQIEAYIRQIETLENEKEILEKEVEKRSEELRVLQSGRRATRGTSVPRSPRMGGNGGTSMSPRGVGVGVGGRIYGRGSRGNSPAPGVGGNSGGVEGPHKGTFPSVALFQGPPAARWGTHLQ